MYKIKKMRFEIEPKIGLGDFILGMNINQVLTLIKRNGYNYKHCQIISGKETNTPTFFHIPSESITLRFNYYTQNLELIEKKIISLEKQEQISPEINKDSEYYYRNKLFYALNKEIHYSKINYENIAKIFGLSKVPKKLNNNKNIFLEYPGIGFYFTNYVLDIDKNENLEESTENSSVNTDSLLNKILIFREETLYESLNEKNNPFNKNNLSVEYDTNNPKMIIFKNENNESIIKIGDHIEDVLRELKHPNYIHYCNDKDENYNNKENGNILYNQISDKIYFLNYFQYGFDIMISNNKVSRIILHTNDVGDSKFGIYERCNFILKLRKDYLNTLLINEDKNKDSLNNEEKSYKKEINEEKKEDKKIEKEIIKNNIKEEKKEEKDELKKESEKNVKLKDKDNKEKENNKNEIKKNDDINENIKKEETKFENKKEENNNKKDEDIQKTKDIKEIEKKEKEKIKEENKEDNSKKEDEKIKEDKKEEKDDKNLNNKEKEKELLNEEKNINDKKDDHEEDKTNNKEQEENQTQKNNNISKSNKKRRRKHGNPPKRKQEKNLDNNDDEEEVESEENDTNNIENEKKEMETDKDYIKIYPWTDFKSEFLSKIQYDKNLRHQKWDEGTSKIINCYFFKGLLFEIIDKKVIGTIIIY